MAEKNDWVEYNEIKAQVSMEMVLRHYQLFDDMKPSGKNHISCCPIHQGSNPRQFSVNLDRNLWNCFGNCKAGGNVLDFIALKEFGNNKPEHIRKAALLAQKWFLTGSEPRKNYPVKGRKKVENKGDKKTNEPLSFALKNLELDHPFFRNKGLNLETIQYFGLGFCTKGTMKNRIAIPIHNTDGQLVAYCGRAVTDGQIEKDGKYKLPSNFNKSMVVYNLHAQPPGQKILIVVESYLSVWWLHQHGIKNVVALMGSTLCEPQKELIKGYFAGRPGGLILCLDADEDGEKCTNQVFQELGSELFIRWIDIKPFAKKPHQLDENKIHILFGGYSVYH